MRLLIVTYGSEGDTRPFVGLGVALLAAGHQVHLLAGPATIHNAQSLGLPCSELPGDIRTTLPLANPQNELKGAEILRAVKSGLRMVNEHAFDWAKIIAHHGRGADGILYAGLALPTAEAVARALGLPAIALWLQPTTPTSNFAAPTVPWHSLPGFLNRLSYRASPEAVMRRLYQTASRKAVLQLLKCQVTSTSDVPRLYGFSPSLVSRPADWPEKDQIAGFWPQRIPDWTPPPRLLDFLDARPRPVYIGFGAISSFVRGSSLRALVDAIAGRAVVFHPGWSGIEQHMLPENFLLIGDTPHEWLFPRTSMVIHHAGAGTTHAVAAAGVPSIPLPIGADQSFWAHRLVQTAAAPGTMSGTRIDASRLRTLIEKCSDPAVRDAATCLGARIRQERGIDIAVRFIADNLSTNS